MGLRVYIKTSWNTPCSFHPQMTFLLYFRKLSLMIWNSYSIRFVEFCHLANTCSLILEHLYPPSCTSFSQIAFICIHWDCLVYDNLLFSSIYSFCSSLFLIYSRALNRCCFASQFVYLGLGSLFVSFCQRLPFHL